MESRDDLRERAREIDRRVGEWLREQRRRQGMTQTELGMLIGVSYQQIQKYESGANRMSVGTFSVLCTELGIPDIQFALSPDAL